MPTWKELIDELKFRREQSLELGGKERVKRQHDAGRLTIRERINAFVDKDSFMEVGQLAGTGEYDEEGHLLKVTPSFYVTGLAKVDGRYMMVGGEDFTIRGGSGGGLEKRKGGQGGFCENMAHMYRIPLVNFVEGAGASPKEAAKGYKRLPGKDMMIQSCVLTGEVPVVSAIMGPCAGGPAVRAMLGHFSVIVNHTAQIFAGGPPLVERTMGIKLTKEELGGAVKACKAGVIHNLVESEEEAFETIKRFLSYMPNNVWELPPRVCTDDPVDRWEEDLLKVVPTNNKRAYDMRKVLNLILDKDSLFEIGALFGPSVICALGRINGYTVGIIANQPMVLAGAITADAARKMTHLQDLCHVFHIPLINFVDCPGVMIGPDAESEGTLRAASIFRQVQFTSDLPRVTVVIRKFYGMGAALTHEPNINYHIAWPTAEFGSLPVQGGVAAAYKHEIEAAADPAAKTAEIEAMLQRFASPFRTAEAFSVEDVIDPRETRMRLCKLVEACQPFIQSTLGKNPFYGVRP